MITFTDEQYARVMDRLQNGRQIVQAIRSGHWDVYLVEEAHRIFGELAEALKDGTIEVQE